jgi:hypothetical protein
MNYVRKHRNFSRNASGCQHEGIGAVLPRCARMELVYGGERAAFSSLRAQDAKAAMLNLELGEPVEGWGRLMFHVAN